MKRDQLFLFEVLSTMFHLRPSSTSIKLTTLLTFVEPLLCMAIATIPTTYPLTMIMIVRNEKIKLHHRFKKYRSVIRCEDEDVWSKLWLWRGVRDEVFKRKNVYFFFREGKGRPFVKNGRRYIRNIYWWIFRWKAWDDINCLH